MAKSMTKESTGKTAGTKAKIITCAVDIFNSYGYESCTTHTIAQSAGLSPGNLYYHFKNKEQIVEVIFENISSELEKLFLDVSTEGSDVDFPEFLQSFFEVLGSYRFFFRDFSVLLRTDSNLAKLWSRKFQESRGLMKLAAKKWIHRKLMKPFTSDFALDAFLDNVFTLIFFGFMYNEASAKSQSQDDYHNHIQRVLEFLIPYHTLQGQKLISDYRQKFGKLSQESAIKKTKFKPARGPV